jgi:hypothetical protein
LVNNLSEQITVSRRYKRIHFHSALHSDNPRSHDKAVNSRRTQWSREKTAALCGLDSSVVLHGTTFSSLWHYRKRWEVIRTFHDTTTSHANDTLT